ncbi:MAG TPA: histidine kinase dimerization/phospho-acceptor domain-containing protein, partial [Anaerolineales bacterium]|nr:histidine kinase dimerization/phospho-acceptor domain-containing protein [Anaerolineales bacterium]
MKFGPIRQIFRPLFGLERRETTARFLYAILIAASIIDMVMIGFRLLTGMTFASITLKILIGLLAPLTVLLFMVRRGYVDLAAWILVIVGWVGITYQAWDADGVYDTTIYVYILIVFVAALLTNWQITITCSILSIAALWFFAIAEAGGWHVLDLNPPLNVARDLTAIFTALFLLIYLVIDAISRSLKVVREGELKYRNFIEQSMEGIWFLSFDPPIPTSLTPEEQVELICKRGRISECNDTLARMYGYNSNTELLGAHLFDLTAEAEFTELNYQGMLAMVRDGYRSGSRETVEQTRDGKTVCFLNSTVGVVEEGHLTGLWGTQLDITALKNTEDALRRSEARTHALLPAVPDMIFELDRGGTILQFISSTAEDALTPILPPERFLDKSIRDVIPSIADQTLFAIERVLGSGSVYAFEYSLLQGNENKTFEARIAYLSATTVLVIVRDISLQKWIRNEHEKLIAELERKNVELERFTYTVSHDLKSPLITIKGFLGFLRDDAKSGNLKRLENDVQRIGDAADKMQRLLNDLLELSRIGRLVNESEAIDLNKLVSEVLELLYGRIHGGNISVKVADGLPNVYGDRPRLFEVLQNLIDNAAKFMGD